MSSYFTVDGRVQIRADSHFDWRLARDLFCVLFAARLRNVKDWVQAWDRHIQDAIILPVQSARLPVQGTSGSAAVELELEIAQDISGKASFRL